MKEIEVMIKCPHCKSEDVRRVSGKFREVMCMYCGEYFHTDLSLGQFLRHARGETSISEVSRNIGISRIYLSEIERGKRIPTHGKKLFLLCDYYDLDLDFVLKLAVETQAKQKIKHYKSMLEEE